jgi:PIN domain nuclease of toxin-antitoxin system
MGRPRQTVSALLLDTHAWAWALIDPSMLSKAAHSAIKKAERVVISPVSIFEIAQKVRLDKWPQMADVVKDLPDLITKAGGHQAPFTPEISLAAGLLDWPHRDPFDRILAATALHHGYRLLSIDAEFDRVKGLTRVW